MYASVAQSVEQRTENPCVDSSILSWGTMYMQALTIFVGAFFYIWLVVKWTWTNKQNKIHNDEPYVRM